jgi:hypothetical protein
MYKKDRPLVPIKGGNKPNSTQVYSVDSLKDGKRMKPCTWSTSIERGSCRRSWRKSAGSFQGILQHKSLLHHDFPGREFLFRQAASRNPADEMSRNNRRRQSEGFCQGGYAEGVHILRPVSGEERKLLDAVAHKISGRIFMKVIRRRIPKQREAILLFLQKPTTICCSMSARNLALLAKNDPAYIGTFSGMNCRNDFQEINFARRDLRP